MSGDNDGDYKYFRIYIDDGGEVSHNDCHNDDHLGAPPGVATTMVAAMALHRFTSAVVIA